MYFDSLNSFLQHATAKIKKGPVALILAEDDIEVASTVRHHQTLGFKQVCVFAGEHISLPDDISDDVLWVQHNVSLHSKVERVINACIQALPAKMWVYYCFNAEYLFFPSCETRTIGELTAFHLEERRHAMLTYIVDLYAEDLNTHPNAVNLTNAMLDKSGYFALARKDKGNRSHPKDRQLDFYGGLRWRFEEHIKPVNRRIDRIGIFENRPDLKFLEDHTFNDQEYNTYSCPWHNNITAAICSFRTAKNLLRNPKSRSAIHSFKWLNSVPFKWHSQQLMDLGLMEPGQWF